MTELFLSRACPCCGHDAPHDFEITAPQPAEGLDLAALRQSWMGFFKEKTFFSYARCSSCRLLFAPIFFTADQLETLYANMPPNMDVVPEDTLRRTQRGYFDILRNHSPLTGNFLEIGPDIGLFTENCVREGSFDYYWLFEPNRTIVPALTKTMNDQSFQIIHDMFGFDRVPEHSVDVAVMVHVLDHLLDPVATLSTLRTRMRAGSRLLIVTHDEGSMLRHMMGWRWPAFCLQHPELYNRKTMARMLDAAGFKVVSQTKTVNPFPIQFLLQHGLWAIGIKARSMPSFGGVSVGLKLGNMLTLATPQEA